MTADITIAAIKDVLNEIRPHILMDGGDIELLSFVDGVVSVRLHGACVGCPMSMYTLKLGLEERLKERLPYVTEVRAAD